MGRITRWIVSKIQVLTSCFRGKTDVCAQEEKENRTLKRSFRLWLFRRKGTVVGPLSPRSAQQFGLPKSKATDRDIRTSTHDVTEPVTAKCHQEHLETSSKTLTKDVTNEDDMSSAKRSASSDLAVTTNADKTQTLQIIPVSVNVMTNNASTQANEIRQFRQKPLIFPAGTVTRKVHKQLELLKDRAPISTKTTKQQTEIHVTKADTCLKVETTKVDKSMKSKSKQAAMPRELKTSNLCRPLQMRTTKADIHLELKTTTGGKPLEPEKKFEAVALKPTKQHTKKVTFNERVRVKVIKFDRSVPSQRFAHLESSSIVNNLSSVEISSKRVYPKEKFHRQDTVHEDEPAEDLTYSDEEDSLEVWFRRNVPRKRRGKQKEELMDFACPAYGHLSDDSSEDLNCDPAPRDAISNHSDDDL